MTHPEHTQSFSLYCLLKGAKGCAVARGIGSIGKGFGRGSRGQKRLMMGDVGHNLPLVCCGGRVAYNTVKRRYDRTVRRQIQHGSTLLNIRIGK